jgi:hypothetical protein
MNKENVMKVVNKLRNGEFTQISCSLRDFENGRCCLGVACEVYKEEIGGEWDEHCRFFANDKDYCDAILPQSVKEWLDFDQKAGPSIYGYMHSASANDNGVSFNIIADEWERLCNLEN